VQFACRRKLLKKRQLERTDGSGWAFQGKIAPQLAIMHPTEKLPGLKGKLYFDAYEVDPRAGEVRKHGFRVRLEDRPFRALLMLLRNANEVVTREELQKELWASDVFVDFDNGLNKAIVKIRRALNDSADKPRFIETLGRHGYRFLAEVRLGPPQPPPAISEAQAVAPSSNQPNAANEMGVVAEAAPGRERFGRRSRLIIAMAALSVVTAAVIFLIQTYGPRGRKLWGKAGQPIQSLAVLPLENLSGDPGQDYFVDGMTDELITNLSKIRGLRVASRASVLHLKGTRKTMPEIAQELKVDAVVEGSVSRVGNQIRIRTQLIRGASDEHMWASSDTTNLQDILRVQAEIARQIAREIRGRLTPQEQHYLADSRRPATPEAYEAYLKGRYYFNQTGREGFAKSCASFEQSINIEPGYAAAYSGMANCYSGLASVGLMLPEEAVPKARAMATRALELDDTLADAHEALGVIRLNYDWDWPGAYTELQKASELDPNDSMIHVYLVSYYRTVGRIDDAVREAKLAQQLDPTSALAHRSLGWLYVFAGRYEDAEPELKKCLELDPHFFATHSFLFRVYEREKMLSRAVSEMEQDLRANEQYALAEGLHRIYQRSGYQKARKYYLELKIKNSIKYKVTAYDFAVWYALLGNNEKALDYLELSYRHRENHMNKLKVNSDFDGLRAEPRFQQLLKNLRLAD
jgi:TolB-like protein/DNA-binding winged helix-turn-helix (wHTH) protein